MRTWILFIIVSFNIVFYENAIAENIKSVYDNASSKFEQKEYLTAIDLYKKAYSLGDTILSPMRIGEIYICGYGVTQNEYEGLKWVQIAAENNNSEAQSTLGRYYSHIGEDSKAFDWFFKAAHNGDDYGKYMLGQAYLEGKGTCQDSKRALRWTLSSALGGDPGAQWEIARAYFEGYNHPFKFEKNAEEFISWTTKAAENGSSAAQYYMGLIYLDGFNNTPVDKQLAKKWIQKAANQGWEDAITALKERF
ncbi:MAG: sel1 repeat family protein [Muribaculaceae bacterium]|nr:sel1 repeat family protein [Muribaculaceae bacterium]